MSLFTSIISTYFELTVSEPCKELGRATRDMHLFAEKKPRFSILDLLRRQKMNSSYDGPAPMIHVNSVKEHYLRDWN